MRERTRGEFFELILMVRLELSFLWLVVLVKSFDFVKDIYIGI